MEQNYPKQSELRPILEELQKMLFSGKYFSDGANHPIIAELYDDLHEIYEKYVGVYDMIGFRSFRDEQRYTDCVDSM